jgi:virginiamycin B lyase
MTTTGDVKLFDVVAGAAPFAITGGPDGNIWFTESGFIGRMTTAGGSYNRFQFPTDGIADAITVGFDGNLWFNTSLHKIGVCTISGAITERDPPTIADLHGISRGPGNTIWFLESGAKDFVVRIAQNGDYTEFPLSDLSNPQSMALGSDGNMWFTEASKIARITADGAMAEFSLSIGATQVAPGPDGNIWLSGGTGNDPNLVRVTPDGSMTIFPLPALPAGLTAGPDGNIWYTEPGFGVPAAIARFLVP